MSRRGFTILELSLAAALGGLVLLAALGVFSSLDRGDRVLAARAVQNTGLEMVSGALEKAIGTLVMETGGQTLGGKKPGAVADAKPAPDGDSENADRGSDKPAARPRFLLENDATPGLPGMPAVAEAIGGTGGSARMVGGAMSAPQRLELVLARHPVPVDVRPRNILEVADTGKVGGKAPNQESPRAVRGEFDLRPEARKPGADGPLTWTLWWRPIERRVGDSGVETFVGMDDLAVPLATGLLSARWSVFYEEAWKDTHSTGAVLELPAYVRLQVTTAAGLEADWLFEVGWKMGPEFQPPAPTGDEAGTDQESESAGASTAGSSAAGSSTGSATPAKPMKPIRVGPGSGTTTTAKPAPPVKGPVGKKPAGRPSGPSGGPSGSPR